MHTKREWFEYDTLGRTIRQTLGLTEEVVKSANYHWRDSPDVGEFGPQNGAEYNATVSPCRLFPNDSEPLEPTLMITLEAVWYFHGGFGSFDDPVESFRANVEKAFNERLRHSVHISNPDNIEPGHYMVSITYRAAETMIVPEKQVEQAVASLLLGLVDEFRSVVSQF